MTIRTPLLLLALVALLAPPARADDDDVLKDQAVFRRQVRVLATVERDAEALRKLVNRVVDVRGGDAGWLDAWFEVAQVLEQHGQRGDALSVWRMVTDKHARELTEAQKTSVHEAMVRLLPAGASATSPLGTIFKAAAVDTPSSTSPVEQKIRDIFAKLSVASVQDQQATNRAQQQVVWALRDAGPEIYPVLGQIILEGQPEQARYAAEKLAGFAKLKALPYFERALRSGDGIARAAALRGYYNLSTSDEVSSEVAWHVDRLLKDGVPSGTEGALGQVLRNHLSTEELMKRYALDGPDARLLLVTALSRDAPDDDAVREALARARRIESERESLVRDVFQVLWRGPRQTQRYKKIDPALLRQLLELMVRIPATSKTASPVYLQQTLERLRHDDPTFDAAPIVRSAWTGITVPGTGSHSEQRLRSHVQVLLGAGYLPPAELFSDAAWRKVFFRVVGNGPSHQLSAALKQQPHFWSYLFDALPDLSPAVRQQLLRHFNTKFDQDESYPVGLHGDRAWGDVLELEPFRSNYKSWPKWLLRAAGAEGDKRVLEAIRRARTDDDWQSYAPMYLSTLTAYKGPGLLQFLEEGIRGADGKWTNSTNQLATVLSKQDAEGRERLTSLAGDWTLPVASKLVPLLAGEDLKRLYPRVLENYDEVAKDAAPYLRSVIIQAKVHLHKEAVPLLLHAYRKHVKSAAEALDAIRAYRERLEAFEGWLGVGDEPARRHQERWARLRDDLERLHKAKEHPAQRKALVYALAVRHGKDAAEALVEIAADDPDESVRQAAMSVLEAMALGKMGER